MNLESLDSAHHGSTRKYPFSAEGAGQVDLDLSVASSKIAPQVSCGQANLEATCEVGSTRLPRESRAERCEQRSVVAQGPRDRRLHLLPRQ